jgi:hypothetical protein
VQDVADLANQIYTGELLTTDPAVAERPAVQLIQSFFFDVARTHGACLYLSINSKAKVNAKPNSKLNSANVERVVYIVMVALEQHHFQGTDIVVATGYATQLHLYLATQNTIVNYYLARVNGNRPAEQAKLVRPVIIDSI